jgi:hypothetical protein
VHRLSAAVITVFALTHVANQVVGFVSESSYAAALTFLREGYHQPIAAWALLTSSVVQIVTGATMGEEGAARCVEGQLPGDLGLVSGDVSDYARSRREC